MTRQVLIAAAAASLACNGAAPADDAGDVTETAGTTGTSGGATEPTSTTGGPEPVGACNLADLAWTVEEIPLDATTQQIRLGLVDGSEPALVWVGRYNNILDRANYSRRDGDTWVHERVRGGDLGMGLPGLAFDDTGEPIVLLGYRHSLGGTMEVSTRLAGTWESVALPSDRDSETSSLARLTDGSFLGLFHQLWTFHAVTPDGLGGWTVTIVDDGTMPDGGGMASAGAGNDLVIDADGVAHISYADATNSLYYATGTVDAWTRETVTTSDVDLELTGLALDPDGVPHIVYRTDDGENLMLATRDGDAWTTTTIEPGGRSAQLEIDAAGRRHLAHTDGSSLRYAAADTNDLVPATVATDINFGAVSLVLAVDGRPWLAWSVDQTLCLGTRDP